MSYIPESISVLPPMKARWNSNLNESARTAETIPCMLSDNEDDFTDDESVLSMDKSGNDSSVRLLADKDKQIGELQRALDWAAQKTMDLHDDVDSVRSENELLKEQLRGSGSCVGSDDDDASVVSQMSSFSKSSRRSGTGILSSFLARTQPQFHGQHHQQDSRWMEEKEKLEDKLEAAEENYNKTRQALGNCIDEKNKLEKKLKKKSAKLDTLHQENEKLREQEQQDRMDTLALQHTLQEQDDQIEQLLQENDQLKEHLLQVQARENQQDQMEEFLLQQFNQQQREADDDIRRLKAQLAESQKEAKQEKERAQQLSNVLHQIEADKEDEMALLRTVMDHLAGLELDSCDDYVNQIKKVMVGIDLEC